MKRVVVILSGATIATLVAIVPELSSSAASPGSMCTAIPEGVTLVVPQDNSVGLARSTGVEPLGVALPAPPRVAVRTPDGTVWAEVATSAESADVYRVAAGSQAALSASGAVELVSGGAIGDRSAAVIIDRQQPEDAEAFGAVIVEYADGEQVDVKDAGGPEYGAGSVTLGVGRLVEGATVDLTETFSYYGIDGVVVDGWYSPTASAPYNAPPLYQWPIAAPLGDDAAVLSWVEGPDWNGATSLVEGGWGLVVGDAVSGAESLRLDLGEPGETLVHADFDGRFWVGSFEPGGVVVVDTTAAQPVAVDAGCSDATIATLDRFGAPPVAVSTTTSTTTPPVPATTQPSGPTTTAAICPTYEPNDRYPIRLCDEGPAVRAIQQALRGAGHRVDVDGYFGPGTQTEVRRFQAAHGLEVDGLVGVNTWAALMPFAAPPGSDADGSGVVDPWELGADPGAPAPAGYIGFEFQPLAADRAFRGLDGEVRSELEFVDSWMIAGDGAGLGTSGLSVFRLRVDGAEHLWSTTLLFDPGSELVNDTVDLGEVAAGQTVSRTCSIDGAPVGDVTTVDDVAVFGVVAAGQTAPAATTRAWQVNVPEGAFTEIDPARVTCTS